MRGTSRRSRAGRGIERCGGNARGVGLDRPRPQAALVFFAWFSPPRTQDRPGGPIRATTPTGAALASPQATRGGTAAKQGAGQREPRQKESIVGGNNTGTLSQRVRLPRLRSRVTHTRCGCELFRWPVGVPAAAMAALTWGVQSRVPRRRVLRVLGRVSVERVKQGSVG